LPYIKFAKHTDQAVNGPREEFFLAQRVKCLAAANDGSSPNAQELSSRVLILSDP